MSKEMIKNCCNCSGSRIYGNCGFNGNYCCDQHEFKVERPIITLLTARSADSQINAKIASEAINHAVESDVLPLSPYLYPIMEGNYPNMINQMITQSEALCVYGPKDQTLRAPIEQAICKGIPVYMVETKTCLPNNPVLTNVLRTIWEAWCNNKQNDEVVLVINEERNAVIEYGDGISQYKNMKIDLSSLTELEYQFMSSYIYKNLDCDIVDESFSQNND